MNIDDIKQKILEFTEIQKRLEEEYSYLSNAHPNKKRIESQIENVKYNISTLESSLQEIRNILLTSLGRRIAKMPLEELESLAVQLGAKEY